MIKFTQAPTPPPETPSGLAPKASHVRPSLEHPGVLLATWFGAGYLPKAPGTWGSLGALPFAWVLVKIGGLYALGIATVLIFGIGLWASKVYMDKTGAHDPGAIVIDEVVGMWIVLLAAPLDPVAYAIGFVFVSRLRRLQTVAHIVGRPDHWRGLGVMIDDVLAGLAGLAVLALLMVYGEPYVTGWGL